MVVYEVRDRTGRVCAYHVRVDMPDGGKRFAWRSSDGTPGLNGTSPAELPLYGTHLLDQWAADARIVIVEGEKAADALLAQGIPALATYGVSAAPVLAVLREVSRRHVVLWPDADLVGQRHMTETAERLGGIAATVAIATWPDAPAKGDAYDYLLSGADPYDIIDASEPYESVGTTSPTAAPRPSMVRAWPDPVASAAFHGLAGAFVRAVAPFSEADPAALLTTFLTAVGILIGPDVFATAAEDVHPARLFTLLVGDTAKGRKGSSLAPVKKLLRLADPSLARPSGLSSGEGLIYHVRDPIERVEKVGKGSTVHLESVVVDDGVTDKRLLIFETEFASVVRAQQRDGSRLSPVLRQAWDSGDLQTLTKNSPLRATGAHVGIIGHITREELLRYLDRTELASGMMNRFLVIASKRAQVMPEPEAIPPRTLHALVDELRAVRSWASEVRTLERDATARALWVQVYGELSAGRPGLLGAATNRAEAQVLRLSVLYAALDRSPIIRLEHLQAGLAVWDYAAASAGWVFGDATGDDIADAIVAAIRARGEVSRTEIRDLFDRHVPRSRIEQALTVLLETGRIVREPNRATGGRPAEVYRATS
jgi:hypothetical protein